MGESSFRNTTWDPLLISSQILCLQTLSYASLGLIVLVLDLLTGAPVNLSQLLEFRDLRVDTVTGWSLIFANVLNAGLGSYYILHLVQRAKLCLDFAVTLHLIHLALVTLYSRTVPSSLIWWLQFVGTLVLVSLGGEYLCMQQELIPINLSGAAAPSGENAPGGSAPGGGPAEPSDRRKARDKKRLGSTHGDFQEDLEMSLLDGGSRPSAPGPSS